MTKSEKSTFKKMLKSAEKALLTTKNPKCNEQVAFQKYRQTLVKKYGAQSVMTLLGEIYNIL